MKSNPPEPSAAPLASQRDVHDEQSSAKSPALTRTYFEPSTVVSRNAQGDAVSHYGDLSWDLSSQSSDGISGATLHFYASVDASDDPAASALAATLAEQQKALMWLYIDDGRIRALDTTRQANRTATAWCSKAMARRVSLFDLFCDLEAVNDELGSLSDIHLDLTPPLVGMLARNGKVLGTQSRVPLQAVKESVTAQRRQRQVNLQTPLMPSAIYCAILSGLIARLDDIERELTQLLLDYRTSVAASRDAPADSSRGEIQRRRAEALPDVVARMRLLGYDPHTNGAVGAFLNRRLNLHQSTLMHTVVAFSGMRLGEVKILPLADVVETFEDKGVAHYVIKGYTHKLARGAKKPASWITSCEGHRAILLAQRIASAILQESLRQPAKGQEALLFSSLDNPFRSKTNRTIYRMQELLTKALSPVIAQAHIDELNTLELDRGWQREGIEVGRLWPLAFHQLRRSLSVYAHRSGMVSLPALKAQLQHITDEMRAYYADGYSRAVNLVFDRDHFSHEWQAGQAESSYFGYALGILFSGEEPFGRGAQRMAGTVTQHTRQETLRMFRDGKLAYSETVFGGCVSTETCKVQPLEPIPFACMETSCMNQVVYGKRLDHVIRTQEGVVATLAHHGNEGVEHRLELANLQVLLRARRILTGQLA